MARTALTALVAGIASLAAAGPVSAAELFASSVSVPAKTSASSCSERPLPAGPGVMTRSALAPQSGWVRAELDGPRAGDWDLAVFDRTSGRLVGGSSSFGSDELAEGLAVEG